MATPVTLFVNIVNTHEDKNLGPSLPDPHACEDAPTHMGTCSNTDEHGEVVSSLAGRRVAGVEDGLVIALGGSSSPALCTSRTGAGGAPCSGRTRPGHRASPGVSAERKEEEGSRWGQEGATRKTETRSEAGRVTEREKEREGARQTHREGPESVYCVTEVVSQGTRAFPASHCPWRHRLRPLTVLGLEPGLWGGVLSPQPGSGCHLAIPQYSMSSHHLQLTKAQGRDRQEHRLIQIRKPRPRAKKTQDHTS